MTDLVFWTLAALAVTGALTVVMTRDLMRLVLGLGALLLATAGLFALLGFGFLALAEVFVYAGGVLVLLLFAIMLVHRAEPGRPRLTIAHDPLAAVACLGLFGFLWTFLRSNAPSMTATSSGGVDRLGEALLGPLLVPFEMAGLLLLAALVAVVSVMGGERR